MFLFNWMCSVFRSCAGEMEVDILEFVVPVQNSKTLFVWDIQPSFTEAQIYVSPPEGEQVSDSNGLKQARC